MTKTKIANRAPTVEEFIALRKAVGWHVPDIEATKSSIINSLFWVCVENDNKCIGTARVVGDGFLVFHVQDVMIKPEYQRKGFGTLMMEEIMKYIKQTAKPTAYIALFSSRGLEPWYSRFGFIERPHMNLGPGMAFFMP